jgi:hypothetical protein
VSTSAYSSAPFDPLDQPGTELIGAVGAPPASLDTTEIDPLERLARDAAPPSNLAVAARRFGDRFPDARRQWPIRLLGVVLIALMAFYLTWMFPHLSGDPWVAWPFAAASMLSAVCFALSVVNGWVSRVTPRLPLLGNVVPRVAVMIPTLGEPVPMVLRTVLSVLEQDYPRDRRIVVVSDDAANPELEAALAGLGVEYHLPPDRWAPGRDGAPKSGNLNSALQFVLERFPGVRYIETRDADARSAR